MEDIQFKTSPPPEENGFDRFSRQHKEDEYWAKRRERRERYAFRGTDSVWGQSPSHTDLQQIYEEQAKIAKKAAEETRKLEKVEGEHLKEVDRERRSRSKRSESTKSTSSEERHKKKHKKKDKKEKKAKKDKKKHKKRHRDSTDVSDAEVPLAKVKKEESKDEWVELTKELRDEEAKKAREEEAQIIGPQIPESLLAKADASSSYFDGQLNASDRKNMLRGEAEGMAAYIAQGKRIPRRGEIGLSSGEISEFEKVGYIMSGTRHKSMEATRLRKENQILTAEEKRLLSGFTQEQRKQKEDAVMAQFQSLISSKRGGQHLMRSDYSHLIGGLSGGITSTILCHPLDFLKIRFAANEGNLIRPKYNSYFHACRTIAKVEGIRGFYQGLTPNLVAAPLSWGLYFHIYHKIHKRFSNDSDPNKQSFLFNFVNGFVSGFIVLAGTNPLWVTKTRLCLQYEASTKQYNGMVDCLRKIYKAEGIRGWYRGFTPGLFGNVNGSLQFALYNFLKDWRCSSKKLPLDHKLGTTDYLIFSSISKIISVLTTYPYQVIRTRLQDHNANYKNMRDCILQTWRREGLRGMYKGSLVAALKQTPAGVITYVVYEHSRRFAEHF
ncbi:hypothetical protein M3Y97_00263000 [Aphelenchoides bicaudatus]|nr:hypothetical protein M3Y97_00263000 [Aphelenchoides bicaudatus]